MLILLSSNIFSFASMSEPVETIDHVNSITSSVCFSFISQISPRLPP
ncbi:MAG: hypothetical protein U9Q66_02495 [Patescibacteria group bacterium]|nr:hypothetical protein [Patescibacteria group bacterium]